MTTEDRILHELMLVEGCDLEREALGDDERHGPKGHQFEHLVGIVQRAFWYRWVKDYSLERRDDGPHLNYELSSRGKRAIAAYRRRHQKWLQDKQLLFPELPPYTPEYDES